MYLTSRIDPTFRCNCGHVFQAYDLDVDEERLTPYVVRASVHLICTRCHRAPITLVIQTIDDEEVMP